MEGAPPFPSHLFANWETFFCIKKLRIRSFSSTVREIVTLAVSEWKTSSAAKRVCMLVTRKRIRLSCSAGNSSWSSEFWVLGQWFLRWHYWLLLAIIFILFTWVEDLVGPLCIFHALLKVSCCLSKIFMHWRKNLMWTLLGRSHKYHNLRSSNPSYSKSLFFKSFGKTLLSNCSDLYLP